MKRSTLIAVGMLTMSIVAVRSPFSFAQGTSAQSTEQVEAMHADFRRERDGGRSRDGGGRTWGGEMFRDVFDAADTDGDGAVTPAEIDAYRTARLAEVDASGDGALSIEEFDTLYRSLTRSRMVDTFQALDADGDGLLATDEMDRRIERLITRLDRDGDGTLTLLRRGQPAAEE